MMDIESPTKPAGVDTPEPAPEAMNLAPLATAAAAAALLAACGGGDGGSAPETPAATGTVDFPTNGFAFAAPASDAEAARFLQQAQFSSTAAEIAEMRGAGSYAQWIANQFANYRSVTGWNWLESRGYGTVDTNNYFFNHYPADFMIWNQLLSGPDMMRKRAALALSEFFVTSLTTAEFTWRAHAYASWWDTLMRNAFGNYRQLLEDVTLHPAMGYFLNTKGNQKENTSTGRVPDENYSREVMQLFSLGVYQLNLDGTVKTSGGVPLETYTQDDVTNLARVFTGYDFDRSDNIRHTVPGQTYTIESKEFARKPMSLNASRHSNLPATFLGTTVPANTSGQAALRVAMDALFNHPNVGPFFARQMIQRLVTSDPSPAYVARVASRFNNNGSGVRGDLKAVWSAILLDDEARGPQNLQSTTFGKLREPMLRFVQWARTFGATSAAGSWKIFELVNPANQLGQSPLRPPSVFNFFRPGYVPPGTALSASGATAPEFQLVNESSVGGYLNFMQGVIERGINCPNPGVPQAAYNNYAYDVVASYAEELPLVTDANALVNRLSLVLTASQLSANTRQLIVTALDATPVVATSTDTVKRRRVWAAILMIMASAEYLIQK